MANLAADPLDVSIALAAYGKYVNFLHCSVLRASSLWLRLPPALKHILSRQSVALRTIFRMRVSSATVVFLLWSFGGTSSRFHGMLSGKYSESYEKKLLAAKSRRVAAGSARPMLLERLR